MMFDETEIQTGTDKLHKVTATGVLMGYFPTQQQQLQAPPHAPHTMPQ